MSKKQNSNVIDIGRYVRVPRHVRRSGVSPRAQQIWEEVAINSSPEKPHAWVRQATIATELKISTDTVGRALKELVQAGLLVETGRYFCGRYKYYIVIWTAHTLENLPQFPQTNPWAEVEAAPAPVRQVEVQKPAPIIRVEEEQKKSTFYTAPQPSVAPPSPQRHSTQQLLEAHEQEWKEKYECLDGKSGRPSVRDCVEEAMNHTARHKYENPRIYLESWLRNAALKFKHDYCREQGAHWSEPYLTREMKARKQAEEEQRRKEYEERVQRRFDEEASKRREPTPEEVRIGEAFLASVRRHDEAMARRAANYRCA
jgi:hypothetical protein